LAYFVLTIDEWEARNPMIQATRELPGAEWQIDAKFSPNSYVTPS